MAVPPIEMERKSQEIMGNHRFKFWLFKYYPGLCFGAAVFLLTFFVSADTDEYKIAPQFLFATLGAIVAFAITVQKRHLDEIHLFKELFTQFNKRYDRMNGDLNRIVSNPYDNPLSFEEKMQLFHYFNLCGEEYLYYSQGFIIHEVWQAWENGMRYYYNNPRIRPLWDQEMDSGSYYGFRLDCFPTSHAAADAKFKTTPAIK